VSFVGLETCMYVCNNCQGLARNTTRACLSHTERRPYASSPQHNTPIRTSSIRRPHRSSPSPFGDLFKCRRSVLYVSKTKCVTHALGGFRTSGWGVSALFCGCRTLSCVEPRSAMAVIGSFGFVENNGTSFEEVSLEGLQKN
jgi:hypothetical protein